MLSIATERPPMAALGRVSAAPAARFPMASCSASSVILTSEHGEASCSTTDLLAKMSGCSPEEGDHLPKGCKAGRPPILPALHHSPRKPIRPRCLQLQHRGAGVQPLGHAGHRCARAAAHSGGAAGGLCRAPAAQRRVLHPLAGQPGGGAARASLVCVSGRGGAGAHGGGDGSCQPGAGCCHSADGCCSGWQRPAGSAGPDRRAHGHCRGLRDGGRRAAALSRGRARRTVCARHRCAAAGPGLCLRSAAA